MIRRIAALLLAAILLFGCSPLREPPSDPAESEELPEQELFDATITFYQQDKLSTVLKAGRIRKYEKKYTVLMDSGIVCDFYDENGEHTMTLWADSGRANERTRNMIATGNVVAVSDSGQQLESSVLRWDQATRRIICDAPVKISSPTDTLYGTSFVSDQHLKNWTLERPEGITFRERPPTVEGPDSVAVDSSVTDSISASLQP
jgi:LPS export ABC transporter protein LptC